MLSFFISHNLLVFLPLFSHLFFLSSISSPPAYLDDDEDEDPFGDYVISKLLMTIASH